MLLYDGIVRRKKKVAVIGLGYVGNPLAVAFTKRAEIIGFDISVDKIDMKGDKLIGLFRAGMPALVRIFLDVKSVCPPLRDMESCNHWSL